MNDQSKRTFLTNTGKSLIGTAALISGSVLATSSHHHGNGNGLAIMAGQKDTCGTCQFWGGMRKLSDDKSQVITQSMGWCNNLDSPNHNNLTAADHKMKKTGIWKKWAVL